MTSMRGGGNRPKSARTAFTLLETMLVLAVMVAVGAFVWPSLQKPFAAQRLRKSADQLHADLTRARAAAIRSGVVRQLVAEPDAATTTTGARYSVTSAVDPAAASLALPATDAGGAMSDGGIQTRTLPEGITLVAIEAVDDVAPPPYTAAPAMPVAQAGESSSTQMQEPAGVAPSIIFFHPDGTTSSARITLANEQGLHIRVELRGLTGVVTKSDVFAAEVLP
jgi:type II secretory pathway pseudopilin PulG